MTQHREGASLFRKKFAFVIFPCFTQHSNRHKAFYLLHRIPTPGGKNAPSGAARSCDNTKITEKGGRNCFRRTMKNEK